jgi:L-ascorbate metabolism protein UlaG (beta-lactamase superfamily)
MQNPKDAALATKEYLKPRFAIPIHYATFRPLRGTPEEYIKALLGRFADQRPRP